MGHEAAAKANSGSQCLRQRLPGQRGSGSSLWGQSRPRAACPQSNWKADTGEVGKNSSCNLILCISLWPQAVTGDPGTCVLQRLLEVVCYVGGSSEIHLQISLKPHHLEGLTVLLPEIQGTRLGRLP